MDPGQGRIARYPDHDAVGTDGLCAAASQAIRCRRSTSTLPPRAAPDRHDRPTADTYPLAGTQITIDGGNGIPAGTYTLYPAHYATLPGAMRVIYYGDNIGRN